MYSNYTFFELCQLIQSPSLTWENTKCNFGKTYTLHIFVNNCPHPLYFRHCYINHVLDYKWLYNTVHLLELEESLVMQKIWWPKLSLQWNWPAVFTIKCFCSQSHWLKFHCATPKRTAGLAVGASLMTWFFKLWNKLPQ